MLLLKSKLGSFVSPTIHVRRSQHCFFSLYHTTPTDLQELCNIISNGIGSLDDLEASLNGSTVSITSALVTHIMDSCKNGAPNSRRVLRFFLWSQKNPNCKLGDEEFNHAIQVFAKMKDLTAMDILISDLRKEQRKMESETFSLVAETLVKLGREDDAVGLFKNLEKFKCWKDSVTVTAIVQALCGKGHARKAEGVVWHHKNKIFGVEPCIYRSLLYGWCVHGNVKESRRILNEMKLARVPPDLFCYNTLLRCQCKRNLKFNPSALVPEAFNLMMEMRSNGVSPTSISFNILLSCLGRTRRVKEACRILDTMNGSGCSPDWVSYYLVMRVMYLTGRFGRGNRLMDEMIEQGLMPEQKFYYDLIGVLCGVERVNHALGLFKKMKKNSVGGYGPVYDMLIPKLCRGGEFEKGRELWDEAMKMGVVLQCSSDVLDPLITEVFKPTKKLEEMSLEVCKGSTPQTQVRRTMQKNKKKNASAN
ncbi:hypothetical protein HHK36_007282 [Tetracentron sinense]|uniref:Pentatricopeptide repeat-containing protein n=1 Tax=Tetracentron sinense TaxID=13715 RepID=A0A834ZIM8_TETSI|nr:hypothetical protein HHK36_007282 [Tetracentron sinense]